MVAVVAWMVASHVPAQAQVQPVGSRVVAPGLRTFLLKFPLPNVVYVAAIESRGSVRLRVKTPKAGGDSRAPTSVLCGRCLVAVNGGFFDVATGRPVPGQEAEALALLLKPRTRSSATGVQWLIKDGVAQPLGRSSFTDGRHPRTFLFGDAEERLWFAAVDGRRPGYSLGMTLPEVVSLVKQFGAIWAVNLDGGCSTTFVVQAVVKNFPCQDASSVRGQRPVANAFVVLPPRLKARSGS